MTFDLEQLKADNLPVCSCSTLGIIIRVKDDTPDPSVAEQNRKELMAELDAYLSDFVAGDKCPGCNWSLGGFLGSFTWGIEHGEGFCSNCQYPCRGHHNIGRTQLNNTVLAFHPSVLTRQERPEEVRLVYAEDEILKKPGQQDILWAIHVIVDASRVINVESIELDFADRPYLVRWQDAEGNERVEGWNAFAALTGDPNKSPPTEYRLEAMKSQYNILQRELDRSRDAMQIAEALDIELRRARQTIFDQGQKIRQQEDKIDDHEVVLLDLQRANKTLRDSSAVLYEDLAQAKKKLEKLNGMTDDLRDMIVDRDETITLLQLEIDEFNEFDKRASTD